MSEFNGSNGSNVSNGVVVNKLKKKKRRDYKLNTPQEKLRGDLKGAMKQTWLTKHKEEIERTSPTLVALADQMTAELQFRVRPGTLPELFELAGITYTSAQKRSTSKVAVLTEEVAELRKALQVVTLQVQSLTKIVANLDETFEVTPGLFELPTGEE